VPDHLARQQLDAGLPEIGRAPSDEGVVRAIVIRPVTNQRRLLSECRLSCEGGAEGDSWAVKCWLTLPDGSPHPAVQITMMNARVMELMAGNVEHWPPAGDNLFVDLDLSRANLATGDQLTVGDAVLEITDKSHTGCKKLAARYGTDAVAFVNSPLGKELRLRGIYAKVVQAGTVRVGDVVRKLYDAAI
jgi:MOSC domain-containing protein YiiM